MFSLTVKDRIMFAHSLKGRPFGPAQHLHGSTCIVEAEFKTKQLNEFNTVMDAGKASQVLRNVLMGLDYQNLDDLVEFQNTNTTIEFLAFYIHEKINKSIGIFTLLM